MKKTVSVILTVCLLLLLAAPTLAVSREEQLQVIRAAGIMVGDEKGNLNLEKPVTRAEFTKMMVAASPFKDSVAAGSYNLFSDVRADHWASGYIKAAVENRWIVGYVDGTFRPSKTITLEEGCTALLRVLGYDDSTFVGAYPDAQLLKAQSVGLRDGLTVGRGQTLTRQDCVLLFYQLLTSADAQGKLYGTSLGYKIENDQVDYNAMVAADLKGPFVAEDGLVLPYTGTSVVYRDGKPSTEDALRKNDVYYYNANTRTVWAYSDKVSGTVTAVAPDLLAPDKVTVSGNTYSLGTPGVIYDFSAQGQFREGDRVTLLLGKDGSVVKALFLTEAEGSVYRGMVVANIRSAADGAAYTETTVVCTDGVERSFRHENSQWTVGSLVAVSVENNRNVIAALKETPASGTFGMTGMTFDGKNLAAGVSILDTDPQGAYVKLYPSRLAGKTLQSKEVRYVGTDSEGKIDCMILQNATGDTYQYGYLASVSNRVGNMSASGSYVYYLNGVRQQHSASAVFAAQVGGIALVYKDGQISNMKSLKGMEASLITADAAVAQGKRLLLAENVQVLVKDTTDTASGGTAFYSVKAEDLDLGKYTVTLWYDAFGCSAGGLVRVITAVPK